MLSTNVLCLKKRKKRSYHVADCTGYDYKEKIPMSVDRGCNNNKSTTMLQITEDTPPDMLAGAMDLIVHLPNGNSVKMSVERSTPMMDLLVQITTNHHLQLSGYTLQPLEMAPSTTTGGYCNDKILPFKPNTPIGVLDTQHIRVVPKIKTIPKTLQKSTSMISNHNNNNNINNGYHQPFESTFRLKVYLPRNQLYVTRISQNVYLEDILKKVCDEKHLDPQKYDFRHPGNLDETLDPKLTLSDYQITELHLVLKGTIGLQQTYPTSDMSLRKEEERKQMHNKTGGGVFNLIFRRGKASSGSVSSENRSISPTHSDDSRSVTPPAQSPPAPPPTTTATTPTPASSITSQPKDTNDKPKPPQRKRRPAPKPPQIIETKEIPTTTTTITETTVAKAIETITTTKKLETGLTICHSRNSSDSSGYHEASVLSDNCGNMSLPRRPKSTAIETNDDNNNKNNKITGKFSQSTSNLSRMSIQSKSTSSLSITGRKKKSAPPPPPPPVAKQTDSTSKTPSPVVASQAITNTATNHENQKIQDLQGDGPVTNPNPPLRLLHTPIPAPRYKILKTTHNSNANHSTSTSTIENQIELNIDRETELKPEIHDATNIQDITEHGDGVEELTQNQKLPEIVGAEQIARKTELPEIVDNPEDRSIEQSKPPEIIGVIPKNSSQSMFDSLTRKRGFQIGTSLLDSESNDDTISVNSAVNSLNYTDHDDDLLTNDELFDGSVNKAADETILNQFHGIHDYDETILLKSPKKLSVSSLRSAASIPSFLSNTNIKKWDNKEELNQISVQSTNWVIGGDDCKTDFSDSIPIQKLDDRIDEKPFSNVESSKKTETVVVVVDTVDNGNKDAGSFINGDDFETDWQYQLPSPPKAFRDSSPPPSTLTNCNDNLTIADSVVTSPELFEKLQSISDHQTDKTSNYSDIDDNKSILNKLSLEHLEKRKSLVYNRELATSLKQEQQQPEVEAEQKDKKATKSDEDYVNTLLQFERTLDELQQKTNTSSQQPQREQQQQKNEVITKSTLPNFKITTYDNPKQKVNIFEDDTVRSNRKFNDNNNDNSNKNARTEIRRNSNDGKSTNLLRTESFQQNYWSPSRPVIRSKSSIALNKYNQPNSRIADDDEDFNKFGNNDENLTKSNSLFDVSGLQSLGVMRLIQSKLNTPRNSIGENLNTVDFSSNNENNKRNYQKQSDDKTEVQNINNSNSNNNNNINNNNNNNNISNNNNKTEKSQQYISKAPSINMGTWSERPKVPVNLKDDPDYKFNTNTNNNNNNNNTRNRRISPVLNINNNNGVNVRISSEYKNVSIKVNGSETISAENTGNVVIKIGEQQLQQKQQQQQNRKPLGNINKIETTNKQRPHSIAFDSDFNISRLPIVRSVELKKPYKDLQQNNNNTNNTNNNTSVIQISDNKTNELNKYPNVYRSHEALHVQQQAQQQKQQIEPKFRLNSFIQKSAPVVRGFRTNDIQRFSWNQPHSYSSTLTLNNKEKPSSQQGSTFQVNLRRTESTKRNDNDKKMMPPPPPPPAPSLKPPSKSAKFVKNNNSDPKEQLLQAIRDFGGKKGLRAVKA